MSSGLFPRLRLFVGHSRRNERYAADDNGEVVETIMNILPFMCIRNPSFLEARQNQMEAYY
eukprot:11200705-Ditylum_brightwellii.AAC.1